MKITIDDYNVDESIKIAMGFGTDQFGYVVTPNVDHLIRYHADAKFRGAYAEASAVLLDSRFLAQLLALTGKRYKVCPGSDLTKGLFELMSPRDRVLVVGGSPSQALALGRRYRSRVQHINPMMGFIDDPFAVERLLREIEWAKFRFCFLAVGSPQQEWIALKLKERGIARGLVLCVGGSINFLTGAEKRAPAWMRNIGMEWAYRLMQNPRRMAKRYLVRGPRIFKILPQMEWVRRG